MSMGEMMRMWYIIVGYVHSGTSNGVEMNNGHNKSLEFMGVTFMSYYWFGHLIIVFS
jgi:hypothetical protein